MIFEEIVNVFSRKLVVAIAKDNLERLEKEISTTLYASCMEELVGAICVNAMRIISYEYYNIKESKEDIDNYDRYFEKLVLSDNYMGVFLKKYAVYCDLCKIIVGELIEYLSEIIANYEMDRSELSSKFDNNFGDILRIECSKGDLHNGKSVAFIIFEGGKLIYKPRNESNAGLLKNMVEFLTKDLKIRDFKFINYIDKTNYSWEEIVEYKECVNIEEMENYYYRAGVLLAAFYFMGSFDLHHENIICVGEYPVVIDNETITKCLFDDEVEFDQKDVRVSVLSTSFIPYVNDQNVFEVNISGILSEDGISQRKQQVLVRDDNGILGYKDINLEIEKEKNIVKLSDGTTLGDNKIRELLIMGFRDASLSAVKNKNNFIELMQDYFANNYNIFRQILRSTQVYYQFIQASNNPEILQDVNKRNDLFSILSKNFIASKFGYLRVLHEIEEMKKGNIPLFYAKCNSKHLYSNENIVCKNYFKEPPNVTVIKKINNYSIDLMNYQIELINKSVAMVQKEELFGKTIISNKCAVGTVTSNYLYEKVKEWVEYIKYMEYKINDKYSSMVCLTISKRNRLFSFDNLNYMLYENGMIPIYMLYFGMEYHDIEAYECGKRLANLLLANYKRMISVKKNKKTYNYSVLTGVGSYLYIAYIFYKKTNETEYLDYVKSISKSILDEIYEMSHVSTNEYSYLDGVVSSVYLITKIAEDNNGLFQNHYLENIIDKIISNICVDSMEKIGFAHGITGICVELSGFLNYNHDEEIVNYIYELICKENGLIEGGAWDQENFYTWCNGKSGIVLGRKIICDNLKKYNGNSEMILNECSKFDSWLSDEEFFKCDNLCLCHGVYGNIEIAKYILDNCDDHESREFLNREINKKRFDEFIDLQWVKGFDYKLENFMLGDMGIAYVMLEFLTDIPSILALEI